MKKIFLFLLALACTGPALAQRTCGPTSKYRDMQDIGNGFTVYYEPGVWGGLRQTHFFDTYGTDGDQICKYLGSTKEVSRNISYTSLPAETFLVHVDPSGRWQISGATSGQTIITSIHCE